MIRPCIAAALLLLACPARAAVPARPNAWIPVFFVSGGVGVPSLFEAAASAAVRWAELEAGAGSSMMDGSRFLRGGPRLVWFEHDEPAFFGGALVQTSSSLLVGARQIMNEVAPNDVAALSAVLTLQVRVLVSRRLGIGLQLSAGALRDRRWGPEFAVRWGLVF